MRWTRKELLKGGVESGNGEGGCSWGREGSWRLPLTQKRKGEGLRGEGGGGAFAVTLWESKEAGGCQWIRRQHACVRVSPCGRRRRVHRRSRDKSCVIQTNTTACLIAPFLV